MHEAPRFPSLGVTLTCTLTACAWWTGVAHAVAVEGNLSFPGGFMPAMLVYAHEVDSTKIQTLATRAQQSAFHFDLPPGRYTFFAEPNEPGAPTIYGAHTMFSACKARIASCEDHRLNVVTVSGKAAPAPIAIDDWDLPDDLAAQLRHDLGVTATPGADELGAPRFSEYPSTRFETPAPPALDFSGTNLDASERSHVQQALQQAPNFAGSMSAVLIACGNDCNNIALVDWHNGKVLLPAALATLSGSLPCRGDEAVQFRRDSRLISVTRKAGAAIATQYFVWKPEAGALVQTAEYQRSADRFCPANPP